MSIAEFETNVGGTTLQMQVEVAPRYVRPENEEHIEDLVHGLSVSAYRRLVAVIDLNDGPGEDGLPDRAGFDAIPLTGLDKELLASPNVMIFAEEV